jgi:hypothetical protein
MLWVFLIFLSLASCGTIDTAALIPGGADTTFPPCRSRSLRAGSSATADITTNSRNVEKRVNVLRAQLPSPLHDDAVIKELLKASAVASYRGNLSASRALRLEETNIGPEPPSPRNLTLWDFRRFVADMRTTLLVPPLISGHAYTFQATRGPPDDFY